MTNGAAAAVRAIKASGAIIRVESKDFQSIIQRSERPLIVMAMPGFWSRCYKYITSYRGLTFYTKSSTQLNLPGDAEIFTCRRIFVPN
jgi:hypothetical protein